MNLGVDMRLTTLFMAILMSSAATIGAQNAELNFEIRNEADVVVAQGTITTTDNVLQRLNDWRLEQQVQDPNTGQMVLKYPTSSALIKSVLVNFFKVVLKQKPTAEMQLKLDEIQAARQDLTDLHDAAVH